MKTSFASHAHGILCASLTAIALLIGTPAGSAEVRTWRSADGKRTFEGSLVAYDPASGMVTVKRADGQNLTFNNTVLSDADIEFLNAQPAPAPTPVTPASSSPVTPVPQPSGGGGGPAVPTGSGGKPADMSKPVQVFILLGQSNMLGFGNAGQLKGLAPEKYPYLVDGAGNWIVRQDVRNVFYCMGQQRYNDWLTGENGNGDGKFGPEIGIGNQLGHVIDAPVMLLKACVGNRALGWDLLPPSAVGTGRDGMSYQGKSESANRKVSDESKAEHGGWYAGIQYDQDIGAAQEVLRNLTDYYPGAKGYEVAGFFWWQGNAEPAKGNVDDYDKNLAFLFNDLRKDFNAPNAKFVCATLGEHDKTETLSQKMFDFAAMPEFKGQAAVFFSNPVSKGSSGGHYGGDAETYMNVGEGMGRLMIELLAGKR